MVISTHDHPRREQSDHKQSVSVLFFHSTRRSQKFQVEVSNPIDSVVVGFVRRRLCVLGRVQQVPFLVSSIAYFCEYKQEGIEQGYLGWGTHYLEFRLSCFCVRIVVGSGNLAVCHFDLFSRNKREDLKKRIRKETRYVLD